MHLSVNLRNEIVESINRQRLIFGSNAYDAEYRSQDGQVLVEALYLSLDPAMRGWLNGTNPSSLPFSSLLCTLLYSSSTFNEVRFNHFT